jgi:coenzyme F420-reducing hydrogenase gamma subunit
VQCAQDVADLEVIREAVAEVRQQLAFVLRQIGRGQTQEPEWAVAFIEGAG